MPKDEIKIEPNSCPCDQCQGRLPVDEPQPDNNDDEQDGA